MQANKLKVDDLRGPALNEEQPPWFSLDGSSSLGGAPSAVEANFMAQMVQGFKGPKDAIATQTRHTLKEDTLKAVGFLWEHGWAVWCARLGSSAGTGRSRGPRPTSAARLSAPTSLSPSPTPTCSRSRGGWGEVERVETEVDAHVRVLTTVYRQCTPRPETPLSSDGDAHPHVRGRSELSEDADGGRRTAVRGLSTQYSQSHELSELAVYAVAIVALSPPPGWQAQAA